MTISLAAVFIPDPVHGGHSGQTVSRICGDDLPGGADLRFRVDQSHADALQPGAPIQPQTSVQTSFRDGLNLLSISLTRYMAGRCSGLLRHSAAMVVVFFAVLAQLSICTASFPKGLFPIWTTISCM